MPAGIARRFFKHHVLEQGTVRLQSINASRPAYSNKTWRTCTCITLVVLGHCFTPSRVLDVASCHHDVAVVAGINKYGGLQGGRCTCESTQQAKQSHPRKHERCGQKGKTTINIKTVMQCMKRGHEKGDQSVPTFPSITAF